MKTSTSINNGSSREIIVIIMDISVIRMEVTRVKILGKVEILVCRILCVLRKVTILVVFDVDAHTRYTTLLRAQTMKCL